MADDRGAARRSARAVAAGALRHHARAQLRPGRRPAGDPAAARPRRDLRLRRRPTTITRSSSRGSRRWRAGSIARRRRRREGVRRHRGGDGEAARRSSRPRLAGQAHQSCFARSSARGCSSARSSPRSSCRRTRRETDRCGTCRACLDICPTAAFPAPYRLDARRCISYLTIEHKGPIPRELRAAIGNRIYGCDDCLAVCPWNKFAQAGREAKLAARDALRAPRLADLVRLDDAAFPRDVLEIAGQAHRPRPLHPQCAGRDRQFRRRDAGGRRRAAARRPFAAGARRGGVGAGRLLPRERLAALAAARRPQESEPLVEEEWTAALQAAAA